MKLSTFHQFFTLFIILLAGLLPQAVQAQAQVPPAQFFIQEDHNGDGRPDWASWRAEFQDQIFQISVYDGNGNMQPASSWQDAADFDDDTWVFDRDADGLVELVIRFTRDTDGQRKALLWDDQNKDGRVAFEEKAGVLKILESDYPTLVVSSPGEWLQPGAQINSQLVFDYDGPEGRGQNSLPAPLLPLFARDGHPDLQERLFDDNADGIIDYTHSRVLVELDAAQYGIQQDSLRVNSIQSSSSLGNPYLYWPLLNFDESYYNRNYFDTPAFVAVDWSNARINAYGITGYPIEYGFHVNNLNPWVAGELNQANFENAMAYYDLASNHDGLPELFIRHLYWPSFGSPFIPNPAMPVNEVRYTWRLRPAEQLDWDFGLSLTGSHPITTTVTFGEYPVQIVPHDDLPSWVVTKPWVNATLVATEGRPYNSSEGIYEWSTLEGVVNDVRLSPSSDKRIVKGSNILQYRCATGAETCNFSKLFYDIGEGLRGEYAPLNGKVELYRNSLDGRLHLKGSVQGVWRLDEENVIRFYDRSGDGYLDLWQHERQGEVVASLAWSPELLLFAQGDEVQLKQARLPAADYRALPPSDHASWLAMQQALEVDGATGRPGSLQEMFARVEGATATLSGGRVEQVQPSETGLNFVLKLLPGYRLDGEHLIQLDGLAAGDYLASGEAQINLQPYQGARVQLELDAPEAVAGIEEVQQVRLNLANLGALDLYGLELSAHALQGQEVITLTQQTLDLAAGGGQQRLLTWQPPGQGPWELRARLEAPEGALLAELEWIDPAQPRAITPVKMPWPAAQLTLAGLALLFFGALLGVSTWLLLRASQAKERPAQPKPGTSGEL